MTSPASAPLLAGQSALVTGASRGIGEAIARALSAAGAHVVINYLRDQADAERIAAELTRAGRRATAVQGDVSRPDDVQRILRHAVDSFGGLDVLVNSAGIQDDAPFDSMTFEQWTRVIAVNLTGAFLCAQAAVRQFLRQRDRERVSRAAGKIVFISSVHQQIPWAGRVNYTASKAGMTQLMKSLAQEVAPHRIRVNSVAPGAIRTEINRSQWEPPAAREALLRKIPYGRIGDTADVGHAVVWLVSDQADYVTGATLFVDGGMTLYPTFAAG